MSEQGRESLFTSRHPPCGCKSKCGDDNDTEGPGVCKGLPLPKPEPLVEIVLVDRRLTRNEPTQTERKP